MKKPLIILTGPTAVGKTAASIGLAKAIAEKSFPQIPCRSTGIWISDLQRFGQKRCKGSRTI